MRIPSDTLVLVADGRRMLFLRNRGDATMPDLRVEHVEEKQNPRDREQGTDEPGRAFASFGSHRNAYSETDFHQLEEDRFAHEAADQLKRRALANDYERLIIVAPPKGLGEMRRYYHQEVKARLIGELNKDLTNEPVDKITRHLLDQE